MKSIIDFEMAATLLILVFTVLLKKYSPKISGNMGESAVRRQLEGLDHDRYTTLNDVLVASRPGETAQIDHIVVSVYGIFVIETKNLSGVISGREGERQWTQAFPRKTFRIFSPIYQNQGHIKALAELLGLERDRFHSIVVFGKSATLKVRTKTPVIYVADLTKTILAAQTVLLSPSEVNAAVTRIEQMNLTKRSDRRAHVEYVRAKKEIRR
ncbi:MAG: NERD domain-containing protein [Firmicutes bacterium]|nr:NERD domain-containing protein [Bacillota bacterium]